jgi:hypothetical protein
MATAPRRSTRARAAPLSLAEEQVGKAIIAQELLDLRRATILSVQPDIEDESDEEPISDDDACSSEDENENLSPPLPWQKVCTSVVPPLLSMPSGPQLPHHHVSTELGFFQCMLTEQTVGLCDRHEHDGLCTQQGNEYLVEDEC